MLQYWNPVATPPEPAAPRVAAYGAVPLTLSAPLWGQQGKLATPVSSGNPPARFEDFNLSSGFALYVADSAVTASSDAIRFSTVSDVATVFGTTDGISARAVGAEYRPELKQLPASGVFSGAGVRPALLIESMGHINYGHGMDTDTKGFTGFEIGGTAVTSTWTIYPLPLDYAADKFAEKLTWSSTPSPPMAHYMPTFFKGTLTIPAGSIADTYVSMCGFGKGIVWLNGVNLGRYWETRGPQHTLYVPAALLLEGANEVIVFETNFTTAAANPTVTFVSEPDFTGAGCTKDGSAVPVPRSAPATARDLNDNRGVVSKTSLSLPVPFKPKVGACVAPTANLNITMQNCATAGDAATRFTLVPTKPGFPGGHFTLAAAPQLCLGVRGTLASGTPNVALVTCKAGDRTQDWIYFADHAGHLLHVTSGEMLDVPNSDASAGARLELYSYNGGYDNQKWQWNATTGQLVTALNSFCVAAC